MNLEKRVEELEKKEAAREVTCQGQQIQKRCSHCNTICKCIVTQKLIPKFCYHCGEKLDYSSSK